MLDHPNPPTAEQALDAQPLQELLRTHWMAPAGGHVREP